MTLAWLILIFVFLFVFGAVVGSFLNVCIARLPMEKSVFWPGSRCGHCYQPVRGWDNIPLVSYWVLRGRCRTCKARFSIRYFLVELLTALCFVGLFYLEVIVNVNGLVYVDPPLQLSPQPREDSLSFAARVEQERGRILQYQRRQVEYGPIPFRAWAGFGFHAILMCFLIVATFSDLDRREIPLSLTGTGTVIGLIGAVLLPWPWPHPPAWAALAMDPGQPWLSPRPPLTGLYPWPVWGPLPSWLAPGGNWQTGLATGLAGLLAGSLLMRAVRFLFTHGLGKEAMGLGDADLMMMAGAFLGWQPVVIAFFVSVVPGLFFAIGQVMIKGETSLPFGPSLALGVVATWLGWHWIGPRVQIVFFHKEFMLILAAFCGVFMLGASYLIRLIKLARGSE